MRTENQKQRPHHYQLLCSSSSSIVSLLPQSLPSFSDCAAPKRKLKNDEEGSAANGFAGLVIRASLLRRSTSGRRSGGGRYHKRRQLLGAVPILTLLLLVAVFSFLSPPVSPGIRRMRRHVAVERSNGSGLIQIKKGSGLWNTGSSELYNGCSNASSKFLTADLKTHPNRFLLISTSGGLNQQRTGITDAVVAAYILNATLVLPMLDQESYWKDNSVFGDIFDVKHFISFLSNDVKIIKQLPITEGNTITPVRTRVPRKCNPTCYVSRVLPLLKKKHAVHLTKFDYRLSNDLNTDLQRLRCRVNYHALQFTDPIVQMGRMLVERMRMKSKNFITLHLRFEPDMLAFSGCYYGGGKKEIEELGSLRRRWKTLHKTSPDKQRRQGRCPLTPGEVGLMLRALGYGSDVHLYVASGEIYGGEQTLAPLRELFPNFHSKDTLASQEELDPFSPYAARMAAIDFIVCDESDVFVTNNNGNMAKILAGRRRYFGHKPTIRANAKKLNRLFLNRKNMSWEDFVDGVKTQQIGFMGEPNETKPGKGEFHENPQACICESSSSVIKNKGGEHLNNQSEAGLNHTVEDSGELIDYATGGDDENDQADLEYLENDNELGGGELVFPHKTEPNSGSLNKEFGGMLSE